MEFDSKKEKKSPKKCLDCLEMLYYIISEGEVRTCYERHDHTFTGNDNLQGAVGPFSFSASMQR